MAQRPSFRSGQIPVPSRTETHARSCIEERLEGFRVCGEGVS